MARWRCCMIARSQPSLMRTSFIHLHRTDWLLEEKKETKKSCAESKVKSVEVRFLFCFLAPWLEVRLFVHISTIFIHFFSFLFLHTFQYQDHGQGRDEDSKRRIQLCEKNWTSSKKKITIIKNEHDRRRRRRMMFFDGRSLLGWLPLLSLQVTCVFFFGILNYIMIHRADETIHHHTVFGEQLFRLSANVAGEHSSK